MRQVARELSVQKAPNAKQPQGDGWAVATQGAQEAWSEWCEARMRVKLTSAAVPIQDMERAAFERWQERVAAGTHDPSQYSSYRESHIRMEKALYEAGGDNAKLTLGELVSDPVTGRPTLRPYQDANSINPEQVHHARSDSYHTAQDSDESTRLADRIAAGNTVGVTHEVHVGTLHGGDTRVPTNFEGDVVNRKIDDIAERAGDDAWETALPFRFAGVGLGAGLSTIVSGRARGLRGKALASEVAWRGGAALAGAGLCASVGSLVRGIDHVEWHAPFTRRPQLGDDGVNHAVPPGIEAWEDIIESAGELSELVVGRIGIMTGGLMVDVAQGKLSLAAAGSAIVGTSSAILVREAEWELAGLVADLVSSSVTPTGEPISTSILTAMRLSHRAYLRVQSHHTKVKIVGLYAAHAYQLAQRDLTD